MNRIRFRPTPVKTMSTRYLVLLGWSVLLLSCGQGAGKIQREDAGAADDGGALADAADPDPDDAADPDDDASGCVDQTPATCPAISPSYAGDVTPLMEAKCVPCHGPGGLESSIPYTSYDGVFARRVKMQQFVSHCVMPPVSSAAGTLNAAQRKLLLTWLVCGAPDN
jgi:hypothetical protein